jgi:hypothetical protein
MTCTVLKSAVTAAGITDFNAAVQSHISELIVWSTHDAAVKAQPPLGPQPKWSDFAHDEDRGKAYLTVNQKWQHDSKTRLAPYPRPATHPLVEASVTQVNGNFVADFHLVNDDPTAEQVLRGKKDKLLNAITQAERAAIDAVLPPLGKRRLLNMQESDAQMADGAMAKTIGAQTPGATTATIMAEVAKRRDPLSTKLLADQSARRAKVDQINRNAAQVMSAVEDLTLANVDAFKIPSLG